ncbi:hypothetical protein M758_UG069900 [Ceratodon purpureus]|nr:hypothetical protein M758_UG069900 [Ceratodon purpureus]
MVHEGEEDKRERDGQRRHYVNVNIDGKPYGLGVTVWNETLGKVVQGLDPSIIDVRHLPTYLMELLIERMNDAFVYSQDVSPTYLRKRIGTALSSYRHDLIKLIQAKQERPPWVKESTWAKLVDLEASRSLGLNLNK